MALLAAYVVPHPPLIVPAVGRGQETAIADTIAAYREVARRVAAHRPDLIVITSPHAPLYRDGFFIADTPEETGSLAAFGQPDERVTTRTDLPFAKDVAARLHRRGIPSAGAPASMADIDHATFVPLHFLEETVDARTGGRGAHRPPGLSEADHRFLGRAIAEAARSLNRRCVCRKRGHVPQAEGGRPLRVRPGRGRSSTASRPSFCPWEFGRPVFWLDAALCDGAAECGLRFQIMAGALEERPASLSLPVSAEVPSAWATPWAPSRLRTLPRAPKSGIRDRPGRGSRDRHSSQRSGCLAAASRRRPDRGSRPGERNPSSRGAPSPPARRARRFRHRPARRRLRELARARAAARLHRHHRAGAQSLAEEVIRTAWRRPEHPRFAPVRPGSGSPLPRLFRGRARRAEFR